MTTRAPNSPVQSTAEINPHIRDAEYAVRGELVIKAEKYRQELETNGDSLPFHTIFQCNIGNPQQLGQKPLTYIRQVLSICHYPELIQDDAIAAKFPKDVITRAQEYLTEMKSTGSYTNSQGLTLCRKQIAKFIEKRDGFATDIDSLFLTDGASSGVKQLISFLLKHPSDAVMCPIPQYPLYSATLTLLNGTFIGYHLNEENGWSLDVSQLEKIWNEYQGQIVSLVIINPGNPTGQCLDVQTIRDVIQFCEKYNIVLLADEVYQENVYSTIPFTSFRKVIKEMNSKAQLVSFHSGSKGVVGECGARAGYFHLTNFNPTITAQLYKLASISLCSNVTGQLVMGLLTNPPLQGDESYPLYIEEHDAIAQSLKRRAAKVSIALNEMEHIHCQPIAGALYAFPSIHLPEKSTEAAKKAGKKPDTFYALELLAATGIVIVPGSGFDSLPPHGWALENRSDANTFHFRTTILPSESDLDVVIDKMKKFHQDFMDKYRD